MTPRPPFAVPTLRLTAALLVVAAALALAAIPALAFVGRALTALVVVAFVALLIAEVVMRPRALAIARVVPERFVQRQPETVSYVVTNRAAIRYLVTFFEARVDDRALVPDIVDVIAEPASDARIDTLVTPARRGELAFDAIELEARSPLGLLAWRFHTVQPATVPVFADVRDGAGGRFAYERAVDAGLRRLRRRGAGTEFESLRDYVPGDAFRDVDWKASARRGTVTVAQYDVERSRIVLLALDAGRLMTAPAGDRSTFDRLVATAIALADLARRADDRVGILAFDAQVRLAVAPARGVAHIAAVQRQLNRLDARFVEPDYPRAFAQIEKLVPARGLVVVFSAVLDPAASHDLLAGLAALARTHRVVLVLMNDAALDATLATPPATEREAYRTAVALNLLDERRRALAPLRARGVTVIDVPAAALTTTTLETYVDLKRRAAF